MCVAFNAWHNSNFCRVLIICICAIVCFAVFDSDRTGFIACDEMKHFIIMLHDGDLKSNAKMGLNRIESRKKGDGLLSFQDVCDLHRAFPSLLFPIFRLQNTIMRKTFSENW